MLVRYPCLVILATIWASDTLAQTSKVEPIRLDRQLVKHMATCGNNVSSEYYVKIPAKRVKPHGTRRVRFTLPEAGAGQVPCAALVFGLALEKFDADKKGWVKARAEDLVMFVEIPGSNGPNTYRHLIPAESWQQPAFLMPVGPGDDVATDAWQIVIGNKTDQKIRYQTAWIRLLLRYD